MRLWKSKVAPEEIAKLVQGREMLLKAWRARPAKRDFGSILRPSFVGIASLYAAYRQHSLLQRHL